MPTTAFDYANLFAQLGLDDLSSEQKEKHFAEMQEIVEQRVFLRVMDTLSEEDKKIYDTLKTDEELDKFYIDRKISLEQIATEEAVAYREELLQNMAYAQGALGVK
jgi:hypothetical protein